MSTNWQSVVIPLIVGLCVLTAVGLADIFVFVLIGLFGGVVVVFSCCIEEPELRNIRKCVDLTWILDPFRVFWGEVKYRRTDKELLRRHKFKSHSELPMKLQDATGEVISLIIRDFLTSWYDEITGDEEMAHESQELLKQAANRAFHILKRVDAPKLVCDTIVLFQAHIGPMRKAWQQVKSSHNTAKLACDKDVEDSDVCLSPLARAYAQQCEVHPAMANSNSEKMYVRNTVSLLLELLLSPSELSCVPGVFILKETIACNAVLSLIHYVSNPDWINLTIIDVLEEMPLEVYRKLEDCSDYDRDHEKTEESEETEKNNQNNTCTIRKADESNTNKKGGDSNIIKKGEERKDEVSIIRAVDLDFAGIEKEVKLSPVDEGLTMLHKDISANLSSECHPGKLPIIQEEIKLSANEKSSSFPDEQLYSLKFDSAAMPLTDNAPVLLGHRNRSESLPSFLDSNSVNIPSVRHDETADYASMLIVSGIESVTVGKEYKVFVIKYSEAIWFEAAGKPIELSRVVKRRYNEFAELDHCLRVGKHSRSLKGVELPRKRLPFPLSLTEPENKFLETRRRHLEAYLHILLFKREIRTSRELMEFLAVNTDPKVAYLNRQKSAGVLRPLHVVSEALTKAKTGIIEGLPTIRLTQSMRLEASPPRRCSPSPFEEVSWKDETIDGQSATAIFHTYLEVQAIDSNLAMTPGTSEIHLLSQIRRQAQQNENDKNEMDGSKENKFEDTDITDRLTALGAEVLNETDSWLLGERVYTTFLALFGRVLDRFVKDELHDILTEARWTRYIGMLKESLWPGGQLRSGDGCPQTDQQKAAKKQEALRLLKNFLPDVLRWAAGSRVYDDVMEELLEMVQDPWINRHLIYTLLDLIIESVIEHSANEDLSPEIL